MGGCSIYKRACILLGVLSLLMGCNDPKSDLPPLKWRQLQDSLPTAVRRVVVIGDGPKRPRLRWKVIQKLRHDQATLKPAGADWAIVTYPLERLEEPALFWQSVRRGLGPNAGVWIVQPQQNSGGAPYSWQVPLAAAGWRGHVLDTLSLPGYVWVRATR